MLDGKVEGAIPIKSVTDEIDQCVIINHSVDLEEYECERLEIDIIDGVVAVSFGGINIEVPRARCEINLY